MWKKFLALCLGLTLTLGLVSVAKADGLPQFVASVTSGPAGARVIVRPVTPCPAEAGSNQYFEASFTDSAGGVTTGTPASILENPDIRVDIMLPWRRQTSFSPPVYSPDTPTGAGVFTAWCSSSWDESIVTQEYAPQSFMVTAPTPRFNINPSKTIVVDSMVSFESVDGCPSGTQISGGLVKIADGLTTILHFNISVNQGSSFWRTDLAVPKVYHEPMGGSRELPLGVYTASVECRGPGDYLLSYQTELVEVVASAPAPKYVALGDSFSAGQGAFTYYDTGNTCYRSSLGYPKYVAQRLGLGEPMFAACGGAVTDDFYVANPHNANEPAQLDQLTAQTEVVTLTIGGNDAGFKDALKACVDYFGHSGWGCSKNKSLQTSVKQQLQALKGKLSSEIEGRPVHSLSKLLLDMHAHAPQAAFYVSGYPQLFGESKSFYQKDKGAPGGAKCLVHDDPLPIRKATLALDDARWINQQASRLNTIIHDAVTTAHAQGVNITYVSPGLFKDHGLCDAASPWLNPIYIQNGPDPLPETFHPTVEGFRLGYGRAFETVIGTA